MKNSIKIITVLGIVTSFFSVYPMEVKPDYYLLDPSTLKGENPLDHSSFRARWKKGKEASNVQAVSSEDLIHKDIPLALMLTALKVSKETSDEENGKTLETINDAVRNGIPLMSHFVSKTRKYFVNFCVCYSKNPTSIFTSLEDYFARQPSSKQKKWFDTVCKGHNRREKEICSKLIAYGHGAEPKIEISYDIASLIFSFISETDLIQQAKENFDKKSQAKGDYLFQDSRALELILAQFNKNFSFWGTKLWR